MNYLLCQTNTDFDLNFSSDLLREEHKSYLNINNTFVNNLLKETIF